MNKKVQKEQEIPPTIMLSFLYQKIKQRNKGPIIKTSLLKEIIKRHFITLNKNGPMKGVNKIYLYEIIQDLINFNLLERINHGTYEIQESDIPPSLLKSIEEKVNYIKRIKFNDNKFSYKSRLEKANEILYEIINELEKSNQFKILNNNCEKRLKNFPY